MFTHDVYSNIISIDNLFAGWKTYRVGKRQKGDVQQFESRLEDNIFRLHEELSSGKYRPSKYQQFLITDPKKRIISKALVRDRLLHQAIYQILYPAFDKTFIFDSYSCRNNKGTHKAFARLTENVRKVSKNYTGPCWALKMDIRKFFDSIDHEILISLLEERIADPLLMSLLKKIIYSFSFTPGKGMPLGNLTSQLFANVYMDPFDKFVKHQLKIKHYLRYADDFLILSSNPDELLGYFVEMNCFLKDELRLSIHPDKTSLRKLEWGIDFVGYVAFPHHQIPRQKTLKRIYRKIEKLDEEKLENALPSYLGYVSHVSSHKARSKMKLLAQRAGSRTL